MEREREKKALRIEMEKKEKKEEKKTERTKRERERWEERKEKGGTDGEKCGSGE